MSNELLELFRSVFAEPRLERAAADWGCVRAAPPDRTSANGGRMKHLNLAHVIDIQMALHAIYPAYRLEALETDCENFIAPRPRLIDWLDARPRNR